MKKYQYLVREFDVRGSDKLNRKLALALNELGQGGWELVSTIPIAADKNEYAIFIFRQPEE